MFRVAGRQGFGRDGRSLCARHYCNAPTLAGATAVCKKHSFVFDFNTTAGITPGAVPAANVFDCKNVVKYAYGEQGDYAVIKLDRAVTGRQALAFRRGGKAPTTSNFTALSYPTGIPLKISRNGKYFPPSLSLRKNWFFGSDLDVNAGSSGGPVFNVTTGTVEGIVSEGPNQTDYVASSLFGIACLRPRKCTGDRCSNGKRGDYTRTRVMASAVPSLSPRTFSGVAIAMSPTSTPIAGDFNGDSISDIFWYAPGAAVDELWTFSKRGTWSSNADLSLSTAYTASSVGDFDGDGFEDIFFTRSGSDRILFGKSDGLTGASYSTAATNPPLAGDFDGDGLSDVILDSQIWWGTSTRANFGAEGFTSTIVRPTATRYATGDFDADGFGDIFWINGSAGEVWYGNSSRGIFTPFSVSSIPSGATIQGDFDGDGRTDVNFYVAGTGADKIWWATSTRGAFTPAASTNDGTYTAVSGDFDGDGASDILWNGITDTSWYGRLQ